jgi:small multidrug resistance pump
LEAVAQEAHLSKGSLRYHFPSKEALITGMIQDHLEALEMALAHLQGSSSPEPGTWLRAYLCATYASSLPDLASASGMLVAIANNPALLEPLQRHYATWQAHAEQDGLSVARATVPSRPRWTLVCRDVWARASKSGATRAGRGLLAGSHPRKWSWSMSMILLLYAILAEVAGTTLLKLSQGLTKLVPSLLLIPCYAVSFLFLSLVLKRLDVGLVYAVWSGVGTALIASIGIVWFKEPLTAVKIGSFALIILGVVGLNLSGAR